MDFVYKNRFLCKLYCWVSQIRYPGFKTEVQRRAKLDLFDYKQIAQPLPKCYEEICTDNNCFGIGYWIRKYAGIKKEYLDCIVEHGYFFGEYVSALERQSFTNTILTFGQVRVNHITKALDKEAIPIGPYINYADDYVSEQEKDELKKQLKRTLLVFFSHASTGCSVEFDLDYMVSKIESIRESFDTVVVSVFWSDLTPELEKRLKDLGYLIFSSGHRYDYNFLSRQKTMISLSDMTMSNSISTHIGYCLCLNKPHWYIKQEVKEVSHNSKGAQNVNVAKQISEDNAAIKEVRELEEVFKEYNESITEEQYKVADKYFGFSSIRSKEELRAIVSK